MNSIAMPNYDEIIVLGELFVVCLLVFLVVAMIWSKIPPTVGDEQLRCRLSLNDLSGGGGGRVGG